METLIYINDLKEKSGWKLIIDIKLDWYWYKYTKNNILKINPIYESK